MKHATLSAAVALALTGSLILACASSEDPPPDTQPTQSAPATEPAPSGTGNAAKPPAAAPDCTSTKCTADSDCTTACGGSGGLGCCDTHVGTCFKTSASACPAPTSDDGGMTGGY